VQIDGSRYGRLIAIGGSVVEVDVTEVLVVVDCDVVVEGPLGIVGLAELLVDSDAG
jgi:hypothetical protein